MTTRRGTTTRGHNRLGSSTAGYDELGVVTERREGSTDLESLRRDLEASERENNRLKDQILSLQALLAQRPSAEELRAAKETVRNVELLLAGANKENERAMMETDRANRRIKILEDELARLAGENWQTTLDLAPRSSLDSPEKPTPAPASAITAPPPTATAAYLEQAKEELNKTICTAEEKEKQLQNLKKAELSS
ncbi:15377_t:CDS:2 [Acaulospora colombiana]|uniref:15377_t:CDS:1 n=1 Tax=Acaulospora colombiana TaxID=27376 RepID=A0ACA9MDG0_9GLOM|nr:15377_t:CDS:2 [Acaulospora colombiana]